MAGRKTKLDAKLQAEICKLLAKGTTDKTACERVGIAVSTFHNWLSRGESEPEGEYVEFLEAVTQARAKAHVAATVAFQTGLTISRVKEKIVKTYTETRLDKEGKPYEYSETTKTEITRIMPPDWRAGEAWLKRRDRDNWSEKNLIDVNWVEEVKAAGLDPAAVEEELVRQFEQLILQGAPKSDAISTEEGQGKD